MKWEYKIVYYEAKGLMGGKVDFFTIEKDFNHLGREGWELVDGSQTSKGYGDTRNLIYTFKRKVEI
jgi:hypothetical protein